VTGKRINNTYDLLTQVPYSLMIGLNSSGQAHSLLLFESDAYSGSARSIPPYTTEEDVYEVKVQVKEKTLVIELTKRNSEQTGYKIEEVCLYGLDRSW
jgi:hypothetical protein